MFKRVITYSLAFYFMALAFSPMWGLHGHDENGILHFHAHNQEVADDSHLVEHDLFLHVEIPRIGDDQSGSSNATFTILNYLIADKAHLRTCAICIPSTKYLALNKLIAEYKNSLPAPVFLKSSSNHLRTDLIKLIHSSSVAARAPPFYT